MKVLITGGSGLVGKHLQEIVRDDSNWIFLSSKDCDLRIEEMVFQLFEYHKPNVVIHLASKVAGLYGNMENNYDFLMDNLKINSNIVSACKKYNVEKLINILSTCIFPDENISFPLSSDQIHNGPPHSSNSGYAYSKRFLHIASNLLSNTTVINLIPTNLYGKYDNYNFKSSHVVPALIHKFYLCKKNNCNVIAKGDGSALRQFLYAGDLAEIIVYFTNKICNKNISVIVSPDYETSIKNLIDILTELFNFKSEIIYDKSFSNGQHKKTTSSKELLEQIPFFEFTDLKTGLNKTIEYFKNNYDDLRI